MDCGPNCLKEIANIYCKDYLLKELEAKFTFTKDGVSLYELGRVAETIGFKTLAVKIPFECLLKDVPLPLIAFCHNSHYVVVLAINQTQVYLHDPTLGKRTVAHTEFCKTWLNSTHQGKPTGVALLFENVD